MATKPRTSTPGRHFVLLGIVLGIAIAAFAAAATSASASHFRAGNLSWKWIDNSDVTFEYTQAWRRTSQYGSGSDGHPVVGDIIEIDEGCITPEPSSTSICPDYLVTQSHVNEDWILVRALAPGSTSSPYNFNVPHTYASSGPFTALTSSCCTISELSNAPDSWWQVATKVNLADEGVPRSSVAPIVTLPSQSGIRTFSVAAVPGSYSGNYAVRYRLATAEEVCGSSSCFGDHQPPSFSVDPTTGQAQFNTTGRAGLWYAGVVVETYDPNYVSQSSEPPPAISASQAQFVLRVGGPPTWTGLTPTDGATYRVHPGETLGFDLTASDPDPADEVEITKTSGPGSLTATNGNPATAHFSFTPTNAQVDQEFTARFEATEISPIPRSANPRTVRIQVVSRPAQQPPPPEREVLGEQELPPPTRGKTANAVPEQGQVFVKLPPGTSAKAGFGWARKLEARAAQAKGFIPLSEARQIPLGSTFDTRKGQVGLTLARNATASKTQTGSFSQGTFRLAQAKKNPMTTLTMKGGGLKGCTTKRPKGGAPKAIASRRRGRRLFGSGRGRFRTRGRHSSATVRGTKWLTKDTCAGTLTTVKEGSVVVRDLVKKKRVVVKAGKRYLARAAKKRR